MSQKKIYIYERLRTWRQATEWPEESIYVHVHFAVRSACGETVDGQDPPAEKSSNSKRLESIISIYTDIALIVLDV